MSAFSSTPTRIAIIVFSGMSLFHLGIPLAVFSRDKTKLTIPSFEITLCTLDEKEIDSTNGLKLQIAADLNYLDKADVIIIPAWHDDLRDVPQPLINQVTKAYKQGKLLVGLCLGSFVFAAANILTDKVITTHWGWVELFKHHYPEITINPNVLYIDEGQIITSAGMAAGLDCCLYVLKRLCGTQIANKVAKRLVTAPQRAGGQVQFIEQTLPMHMSNNRLTSLLGWLQAHLADTHTIDQLAQRTAMSRRSFTRHFRELTGYSLNQWLIQQRISCAQSLLENTALSLEQIAQQVGFNSSSALRHHFLKKFNLTPNQYQKNFHHS